MQLGPFEYWPLDHTNQEGAKIPKKRKTKKYQKECEIWEKSLFKIKHKYTIQVVFSFYSDFHNKFYTHIIFYNTNTLQLKIAFKVNRT